MLKLDIVHDLQAVYRLVVQSTSRPGTISDLSKEAALVDGTDLRASLLLLALTLLDQEVTFKVFSAEGDTVSEIINQWTYAKPAEAEQADYIFVLQDAKRESLEEAIQKAKPGTLNNPHESATVIAEADSVTTGGSLILRGPGIQTAQSIYLDIGASWIESRQAKNHEFPLGIDMMFIDQDHKLLSLPRTTQITGG